MVPLEPDEPRGQERVRRVSGVWRFNTTTPLQRPERLAGLASPRRCMMRGLSRSRTGRIFTTRCGCGMETTAAIPMTRSEDPIFEYACHEGNYGMTNMLMVGRAADAEAAKR